MTCSARGCRKNKKCQRCIRQTNKNTYEMENAEIFRSLAFIGEDRRRRYRNWLKTLRIGSAVAVCYDGKVGRARAGIVERALGKGTVWVRFSAKAGIHQMSKLESCACLGHAATSTRSRGPTCWNGGDKWCEEETT